MIVKLVLTSLVLALPWAAGAAYAATPAPAGGALAPIASQAQRRGNPPQGRDDQAQRRPARMRFEVMDRDNDGVVTRAEWRGSARSFEVHDWNGDGQLSGEEVRIGSQQNEALDAADHDPSRAERYVAWTEQGFASLDHNRDRRITSNEWHYDRESFVRADRNRDGSLDRSEFLGADMDDDRGDQFVDLDSNGNGRVEREEWHASADAFTWLDRNRDGVLSRTEVVGDEQSAGRDTRDQFASLDVDGNGAIGQDEWHWSRNSFTQRDTNRDGVLSRREFAAAAAPGPADPARASSAQASSQRTSPTVRVDAQRRWTDTGLDVRAGDVLTFTATGTIQMSTDGNDKATPAGSVTRRTAAQAPVDAVAGALIARAGDASEPFFVGDRRSVTAPASGRLYLGVNDDHLADNTGQFDVTVGIQRR